MLRTALRSSAASSLRRALAVPTARPSPVRQFATENKTAEPEGGSAATPASDAAAAAAEGAKPGDAAGAAGAEATQIDQLTKQLAEKEAQIAELNDRTLRTLAEMENVRTIARRDVDNARKYAAVPFAKSLLNVADNLALALGAVSQDALDDAANTQLKGLHVGVAATEAELLKVFSQHGITRFGEVGDKFDPNRYQAMFEAPSADVEPGTVMDVTKMGYELGDRILRPAEVGVSRAP